MDEKDNKTTEQPQVTATPAPTQTPINQPKNYGGLAIAGMVVGIIAVALGWVPFLGFCLGVTAIILSIIALKKKQSKGMSITGIVTGAVSIVWSAIVSAFLIISMIGIAAVGTQIQDTYTNYQDTYNSYTDSQQTLINAKKDFSKGETARFENFDIKVNSIQRNYTNGYYQADDGKEYIVVNVSVTNKSSDSEYFAAYDLEINDDGLIDSHSYVSVDSEYDDGTLAAGATETGNIVYEVKSGSKNLKLQYETTAFDEDYNSVKLTYTLALY